MDRSLLRSTYWKYYPIRIEDVPDTENHNFKYLLQYIGNNNEISRFYKKKKLKNANIGKAYYLIQEKTNELLRIEDKKGSDSGKTILKNKLKTSKKEIIAIRRFHKKRKGTYVSIPYKVFFIFSAIVVILKEMKNRGDVPPIPENLIGCIGKTYKLAFYHKQIEGYNRIYDKISIEDEIKRELKNDFEAPNSPFRIKFGNEV